VHRFIETDSREDKQVQQRADRIALGPELLRIEEFWIDRRMSGRVAKRCL
jgi:hypothetical protein